MHSKNRTKIIAFSIPQSKVNDLLTFYEDGALPLPSVYHLFFAKSNDLTIAIYQPKKGECKVVIQGEKAEEEMRLWSPQDLEFAHAGSDEVGTGDFFGPLVVVASYASSSILNQLQTIGVKDSKLLTDTYMKEIKSTLQSLLPHVTVVIHPEKYATFIQKGMNMNQIKASMHHVAIEQLMKKYPYNAPTILDQFATDASMKRYFKNLTVLPQLQWEEKAESKYLAVAASSMLARVRFLEEMSILNDRYQTHFPLGANPHVESFALTFAQKHSLDTLKKVCKINFSTLKRVEDALTKLG
jgi:ribonuclease HIII